MGLSSAVHLAPPLHHDLAPGRMVCDGQAELVGDVQIEACFRCISGAGFGVFSQIARAMGVLTSSIGRGACVAVWLFRIQASKKIVGSTPRAVNDFWILADPRNH